MAEDGMLIEAKRRFTAVLESKLADGSGSIDMDDELVVSRPLSHKEAIGNTQRDDFPLLRGKEVLMQAMYRGSAGQAFTSASGGFLGSLREVLEMPLEGSFERAVLVSSMNAVLGYLGLVKGTVHCRDDGPDRCAGCIYEWIREQEVESVGLVGLQPALLEALVRALGKERVMVSDLEKAGDVRLGIAVQDGLEASRIFERCQLVLITGSTIVNGTIDDLYESALRRGSRAVFYGTTIAGASHLLGLERWCPVSSSNCQA